MSASCRAATVLLLLAGPWTICGATKQPIATGHGDSYYNYSLSRQAWYDRDFDAALSYMQAAVEADPESVALILDLAKLYYDLNKPEKAMATARDALTREPDAIEGRRLLADSLLVLAQREGAPEGLYEQALEAYHEVVALAPDDPEAYLSLAKLQLARGAADQALESLQRHLDLQPQSDEGVYLAAQTLIRMERAEEAVPMLLSALQRRPRSAQLRLVLVDAYETMGEIDSALLLGSQLQRFGIDPLRANLIMVRLSQKKGDYAQVYAHLVDIARQMESNPADFSDSDRAEILIRMVQALIEDGRAEDAASRAGAGAKQFPEDHRFVMRQAEALLLAGSGKDADELLQKLMSSSGNESSMVESVSDVYLAAAARRERSGDVLAARGLLERSIQLDPLNDTALNYLGYMLADSDLDLEKALGYIERALERDPDNGAYLDSLGWAQFKLGNLARAERALDVALEKMTDEPAVHEHLGDVYLATGRVRAALDSWQRALDLGSENKESIEERMAAARKASDLEF